MAPMAVRTFATLYRSSWKRSMGTSNVVMLPSDSVVSMMTEGRRTLGAADEEIVTSTRLQHQQHHDGMMTMGWMDG